MFTYTLPSWGLRRAVVLGPVYAEPYEAALLLGINGNVFRAAVIVTSLAMLISTVIRFRKQKFGVVGP